MAARVYIETTIVSYLGAQPSRDLVRAAHQEITREWWSDRRGAFDLFVSQLVLDEAGRGDAQASRMRLSLLDGIPLLPITEQAVALADVLVSGGALPAKAGADALHLAIATMHRVDFLLTWNCRHLANGNVIATVGRSIRAHGFEPPVICTPEWLMEEGA